MNRTGLIAKISIKYVLPTGIWKYFWRISRYFLFFFLISRDFAEIPEFRGSATPRNIRSLDLNMYEGNWCLIFRAFWSTFSVLSDNESTWYNLQNTDHVHCTLYIVSYFGEILQHSLSGFCWDTNNRKWTVVPFHFS